MNAPIAAALASVLFAVAAQPALADDHRGSRVSYQALTEYCAKQKPDSRSITTLTTRDGKKVTGLVDCETDYEFHARRSSDDGHRRGGDDRRHHDDDDHWDDDRWDD